MNNVMKYDIKNILLLDYYSRCIMSIN